MEDESTHGARTIRLDQPAVACDEKPVWQLEGLGLRPLSQARPWVLSVILICGFTIWGHVFIGPNGRLLPGRTDEHRTDFTVFTEAGAAFFDGRNPYGVTNPRGWHYLYPPLFALVVAPLSLLDTESQVLFWYAVNVAFTFGCIGESRRLWRTIGASEQRRLRPIAVCAALAVVLPFLDCMQAGQLGIAILYLLMLGSRLVLQSRKWVIGFLGGLTLALPASVKLVPALPVVFLLGQQWLAVVFPFRGQRPWARAIGSTAGVSTGAILFLLLIPASIIGWQKNLHSLDVWQRQVVMNERVGTRASFNVHSYRNQSLANGVYLWSKSARRSSGNVSTPGRSSRAPKPVGAGSARRPELHAQHRVPTAEEATRDQPERIANPAVRVAIGVILIVLLAVAVTVGRRGIGLDAFSAFALASCATLLVSPLAWGHYFMVELPALLCVPIWLSKRGMHSAARISAVVPVLLSWSYYLAMPQFGGLGLLGLGTAGWFLAVCALMVWLARSDASDNDAGGWIQERNAGVPSRPHKLTNRTLDRHPLGV
jgi:Glycosyltransferase family 87